MKTKISYPKNSCKNRYEHSQNSLMLGVGIKYLLPFLIMLVWLNSVSFGYDPAGLSPNPGAFKVISSSTSINQRSTKLTGIYVYTGVNDTIAFYNNKESSWESVRLWFTTTNETCSIRFANDTLFSVYKTPYTNWTAIRLWYTIGTNTCSAAFSDDTLLSIYVLTGVNKSTTDYDLSNASYNTLAKAFDAATAGTSGLNYELTGIWPGTTNSRYLLGFNETVISAASTALNIDPADLPSISTTNYDCSNANYNTVSELFDSITADNPGIKYGLTGTWSGATNSQYLLAFSEITLSSSSTILSIDKSEVGNLDLELFIPASTLVNIQFGIQVLEFIRGCIVESKNATLPKELTIFYIK